jgi:hypothetical protein
MSMQTLYGLLYLEINLAASLLVLFIRIKTIGISRMVSQRNFSMAIDAEIVFFLSDTVAVLIVYGLLPFSRFGLMAAKTVYFFSTALMCFFWFIYFEHMQGSAFVADRKKGPAQFLPCVGAGCPADCQSVYRDFLLLG